MSVIIKKLTIEKLFGKKNIEWELNEVNVLVGKNGSGKSTILRTIYGLLRQDSVEEMTMSTSASITLSNQGVITNSLNKLKITPDMIKFLVKSLKEEITKKKQSRNKLKEINFLLDTLQGTGEKSELKEVGLGRIDVSENLKGKDCTKVELISTINMSANSINELKKSDGEITTVLDLEIKNELARLNDILSKEDSQCQDIKSRLTSTINKLFQESDKEIKIDNSSITFNLKDSGENLPFNRLSSGERQLIYILIKVANCAEEDTVLLMDEPEISLHLSWQEQLISSIREINKKCQIIIVTHSPAIIMKGWMNSYIDISSISKDC